MGPPNGRAQTRMGAFAPLKSALDTKKAPVETGAFFVFAY
jgi:hypothetical protein